MIPQQRLEALQKKKNILNQLIEKEENLPSTDTTILRHMKKQKLKIKEIIQGVREDRFQNV